MSLREVFNKIAPSWARLRTKPLSFVLEFLKGKSGTILVEGCGSGRHSVTASELGFKVLGIDFSPEMVKIALKQDPEGSYLVADVRALPFKDKVFDYSLSIAVLHHLEPEEGLVALRELKRVTSNESLISVWSKEQPRFKDSPKQLMIPWGTELRFYYLYESEEFKRLAGKVFEKVKEVPDEQNIILRVF
ncbi:methyltransferase domain-containing protein [archaeon]|nr:methyltransferase domain-containing protein [archaeon]